MGDKLKSYPYRCLWHFDRLNSQMLASALSAAVLPALGSKITKFGGDVLGGRGEDIASLLKIKTPEDIMSILIGKK